jgi:hypothetical protein
VFTVVCNVAEVEAGFSVPGARPGYNLAQYRRLATVSEDARMQQAKGFMRTIIKALVF